jgi:peptidoglycan/xylan/chitin deacetylase (PgdA/CDA1 family)
VPPSRFALLRPAAALLLAAALGACGSAAGPSPSESLSPAPTPTPVATPTVEPTPTPTSTPTPTLTPSPSPTPFHVISASDCNPSEVPSASPVPTPAPRAGSKFVLHVPILLYHRVIPQSLAGSSNRGLVVPPSTFTAQLDKLKQAGWHTITLGQLADDLAAGLTPVPKTFVITIDDGWADGYTHALPILQKEGFVATFFVVAGRIDQGSFLSADQIRGLEAAGMEVGNHTLSHLTLTHIKAVRAIHEVDSGAATLAEVLGHWPTVFAYPSGRATAGVEGIVAACQSTKIAVIEGMGTYESWANRFAIPRISVSAGVAPSSVLLWVQNPWLPKSMR